MSHIEGIDTDDCDKDHVKGEPIRFAVAAMNGALAKQLPPMDLSTIPDVGEYIAIEGQTYVVASTTRGMMPFENEVVTICVLSDDPHGQPKALLVSPERALELAFGG